MKTTLFPILTLLFVSSLFLSNSFATNFPHIILEGHTDDVNSVAFSPDGNTLASGSDDETIRLWNAVTGEHQKTLTEHTDDVNSVAFSPDGNTLASGSDDNTIHLWNAVTGEHQKTLTEHTDDVNSVAFSPDGNTLASGSDDETIRLWNAVTGEHQKTLTEHRNDVNSVAFSPDGNTLASGSDDETIRLWDAITGEHKQELTEYDEVSSVTFSADGATLASATRYRTSLRDAVTGVLMQTLGAERIIAFSPDGSTFASRGSGGAIRLWDVAAGTYTQMLEGHTYWVTSLAFSPDGRTLASGSGSGQRFSDQDSTIRLWNLSTHVSITPSLVESPVVGPAVGEQFVINVSIAGGQDVRGYRVTVGYNRNTLKYVSHTHGDYLPGDVFIGPTTLSSSRNKGSLFFNIVSPDGVGNGDGTLATITFEVVALKASLLTLSVTLSDSNGERLLPVVKYARVMEPQWDVNGDGSVDILDLSFIAARFGQTGQTQADINRDEVVDIKDLVLVAGAFGKVGAAPSAYPRTLLMLTAADIQDWLTQAQQVALTDPACLRGIAVLEQLLAALTPKESTLLPNYPNPFNPETWIPYHLANAADVTLTVYDIKGAVVRQLYLGHQSAGYYTNRSKAAYWDGRNASGESVASGVYFYYLSAGDYSATRRMVIVK